MSDSLSEQICYLHNIKSKRAEELELRDSFMKVASIDEQSYKSEYDLEEYDFGFCPFWGSIEQF